MYDIAAIGNPVFDIIITPYVKTNGRVLSGCSTNAALAVGKLGGYASLIGKVGADHMDELVKVASKYNVEAFPLLSKETGGFYLRYIDERMNDRELRVLGIAEPISFSEIDRKALEAHGIVLGPILKEISLDFVHELREELDDVFIIVDPQGLIREIIGGKILRRANKEAYEVIKITNVTKPNEHEAEVLFPGMKPYEAAKKIYELNGVAGIVTVAEKGSYIAFEKGVFHIPAYRTIERDPTGCGDVYAGAFLYRYLKTGDFLESAIFASAAASFMVEDTGPHFNLNSSEVEKRVAVINEDVRKIE